MRSFLRLAVIMSAVIGLTACKSETNYFSTSNASSSGNGAGGAVDSVTGFRIRLVDKTGIEGFIYKFGTQDGCEIPLASKDTPTAIQCMLNMMEYDVFFYGFETEINVPGGFCSFIEEVPYRYYKSRPGAGPNSIVLNTTDAVITSCSIDGVAGTVSNNTCIGAEAQVSSSGAVSCTYDYSISSNGLIGPNCCVGRGTVSLSALNSTTGVTTPTSTQVVYSGSLIGCTESPYDYIDSWPKANGYAGTFIAELPPSGFSRKTKMPSVLKLQTDGRRTATRAIYLNANFYDWASYAAGPTSWVSTSTKPRAIQPINDLGPNGNNTTNTTAIGAASEGDYQYRCLGPAGELRHKISLYVNGWNTKEDFDSFKANNAPASVTPNRTGTAGVNCAAVPGTVSCNSFWGFDDMILNTSRGNGVPAAFVFPDEYIWGTPP